MFTQGFSIYYSPLNFLPTNIQGTITAIRNQDEQIVQQLLNMGIQKGTPITLEENFPTFVIRVGESRIAIAPDLASSIKVRITTAK